MTLEKYDELDRLNQLELAKIGKVAPVSLTSSLGLEATVPLVIKESSQLEQSIADEFTAMRY